MDEAGNHHSQQTDTRTENQTPHALTYKWILNNESIWTQEGEHQKLGPVGGWGARGGAAGGGGIAGDSIRRNTYIDDNGMDAANTKAHVYLCNKTACSAHVPQNLEYNNNNKNKNMAGFKGRQASIFKLK